MTFRRIVGVRLGLAVAVLVALVALVAGPAAFGAAPGAAASSTRSGTSRSPAGVAIDRRIAREAGLQRSDFPAGWTSSRAPAQAMGSACPGVNAAEAAVSARRRSREFMLDDSATAQSAVYVYPDTATSVRSFAHMTSRATTACLVRVLRDSLGFQLAAQGASLDSLSSRVLIIAPVGDQHSAHLVIVHISAGAAKATAYADVIFIRVRRSVAGFSLGGVGQIFNPGLEAKLTKAVADRLASAPGRTS